MTAFPVPVAAQTPVMAPVYPGMVSLKQDTVLPAIFGILAYRVVNEAVAPVEM